MRVQWGYSECTLGVQRGYTKGTMYPNLRSPKEEGKYLDRRRCSFLYVFSLFSYNIVIHDPDCK